MECWKCKAPFESSETQNNHDDTDISDLSKLEEAIISITSSQRAPGCSYCHMDSYGNLESGAVGITSTGGDKPLEFMTKDTQIRVGSCSKPVTALLVACLVSKGIINLEDSPYKVVGDKFEEDLAKISKKMYDYINITYIQLLNHTSGMANEKREYDDKIDMAFQPGSEDNWRYCSYGFSVLQKAIEKITNSTLELLAKQYIFEPLGMSNSSYLDTPDLVPGHNINGLPTLKDDYTDDAAGSLITTSYDFGQFMRYVWHAMKKPEKLSSTISPTPILYQKKTLSIFRSFLSYGSLVPGPTENLFWGLGFGTFCKTRDSSPQFLFHWGQMNGYWSLFWVNLDGQTDSMCVFIHSNAGLDILQQLTQQLRYFKMPSQELQHIIEYLETVRD